MFSKQPKLTRRSFLKASGAAAGAAAFGGMSLPAFAQDEVREDLQGQIVIALNGNSPADPTIEAMNAAYKSIRPMLTWSGNTPAPVPMAIRPGWVRRCPPPPSARMWSPGTTSPTSTAT